MSNSIRPLQPSFPRIEAGTFVLVRPYHTSEDFEPYWEPIHLFDDRTEDLLETRTCIGSQIHPHCDWKVHGSVEEALDATRNERLGGCGIDFLIESEIAERAERGIESYGAGEAYFSVR